MAKILSGIIGVYITRGNAEATERLLPQFRRMAENADDMVERVTGQSAFGLLAFWSGDSSAVHVRGDSAAGGGPARPAHESIVPRRDAHHWTIVL